MRGVRAAKLAGRTLTSLAAQRSTLSRDAKAEASSTCSSAKLQLALLGGTVIVAGVLRAARKGGSAARSRCSERASSPLAPRQHDDARSLSGEDERRARRRRRESARTRITTSPPSCPASSSKRAFFARSPFSPSSPTRLRPSPASPPPRSALLARRERPSPRSRSRSRSRCRSYARSRSVRSCSAASRSARFSCEVEARGGRRESEGRKEGEGGDAAVSFVDLAGAAPC